MDVMPFDELNKFEDGLSIHFEDGKIRSKQDAEDIIDEMFDLDADKEVAEVDEAPEKVEISNKYDWSW